MFLQIGVCRAIIDLAVEIVIERVIILAPAVVYRMADGDVLCLQPQGDSRVLQNIN